MNNSVWQFSLEVLPSILWVTILTFILIVIIRAVPHRLLVLSTLIVTLFLVSLGAYVRLADAGLGCPDWPGCYGKLTPSGASVAISQAETKSPYGPVTAEKAWIEMVHRYLASFVGVLIVAILAQVILFNRRTRGEIALKKEIFFPSLLLVAVIFQGLLGKWTVTMLLKPAIVTMHLAGGMIILGLLAHLSGKQLSHVRVGTKSRMVSGVLSLSLVAVFIQILLGGWVSTNYAALVCIDFPTCQGQFLPDTKFSEGFNVFRDLGEGPGGEPLSAPALTAIQITHRYGALIVSVILIYLSQILIKDANSRIFGILIVVCLAMQIGLGVINVVYLLPFFAAVAHNTVAGLLLSILVMLKSRLLRN